MADRDEPGQLSFPVWSGLLVAVIVLAVVAALSKALELLDRWGAAHRHAGEVLRRAFRELTLLGIVSLLLFIVEESHVINSDVVNDELALEHVALFCLAAVFIVYVAVMLALSRRIGRHWRRLEERYRSFALYKQLKADLAGDLATLGLSQREARLELDMSSERRLWRARPPRPPARQSTLQSLRSLAHDAASTIRAATCGTFARAVCTHPRVALRYYRNISVARFLEQRQRFLVRHMDILAADFSFASYLTLCKQHVFIKLVDIHVLQWCGLAYVLILDLYLRSVWPWYRSHVTATPVVVAICIFTLVLAVIIIAKMRYVHLRMLHSEFSRLQVRASTLRGAQSWNHIAAALSMRSVVGSSLRQRQQQHPPRPPPAQVTAPRSGDSGAAAAHSHLSAAATAAAAAAAAAPCPPATSASDTGAAQGGVVARAGLRARAPPPAVEPLDPPPSAALPLSLAHAGSTLLPPPALAPTPPFVVAQPPPPNRRSALSPGGSSGVDDSVPACGVLHRDLVPVIVARRSSGSHREREHAPSDAGVADGDRQPATSGELGLMPAAQAAVTQRHLPSLVEPTGGEVPIDQLSDEQYRQLHRRHLVEQQGLFWLGKPVLMLSLLQLTFFLNALAVALVVFLYDDVTDSVGNILWTFIALAVTIAVSVALLGEVVPLYVLSIHTSDLVDVHLLAEAVTRHERHKRRVAAKQQQQQQQQQQPAAGGAPPHAAAVLVTVAAAAATPAPAAATGTTSAVTAPPRAPTAAVRSAGPSCTARACGGTAAHPRQRCSGCTRAGLASALDSPQAFTAVTLTLLLVVYLLTILASTYIGQPARSTLFALAVGLVGVVSLELALRVWAVGPRECFAERDRAVWNALDVAITVLAVVSVTFGWLFGAPRQDATTGQLEVPVTGAPLFAGVLLAFRLLRGAFARPPTRRRHKELARTAAGGVHHWQPSAPLEGGPDRHERPLHPGHHHQLHLQRQQQHPQHLRGLDEEWAQGVDDDDDDDEEEGEGGGTGGVGSTMRRRLSRAYPTTHGRLGLDGGLLVGAGESFVRPGRFGDVTLGRVLGAMPLGGGTTRRLPSDAQRGLLPHGGGAARAGATASTSRRSLPPEFSAQWKGGVSGAAVVDTPRGGGECALPSPAGYAVRAAAPAAPAAAGLTMTAAAVAAGGDDNAPLPVAVAATPAAPDASGATAMQQSVTDDAMSPIQEEGRMLDSQLLEGVLEVADEGGGDEADGEGSIEGGAEAVADAISAEGLETGADARVAVAAHHWRRGAGLEPSAEMGTAAGPQGREPVPQHAAEADTAAEVEEADAFLEAFGLHGCSHHRHRHPGGSSGAQSSGDETAIESFIRRSITARARGGGGGASAAAAVAAGDGSGGSSGSAEWAPLGALDAQHHEALYPQSHTPRWARPQHSVATRATQSDAFPVDL